MSKRIDTSKPEKLTEDELRYLLQREPLPRSVKRFLDANPDRRPDMNLSRPKPIEDQVHTGTANSYGLTKEQLDEAVAAFKAQQDRDYEGEGDEEGDDEDEVDYDSMTNDELRAELARRELSVEGKKVDLIARLEEDDTSAEEA